MPQTGQDLQFPGAAAARGRRTTRFEDLHRDRTVLVAVPGAVHPRGTPETHQRADLVPPGQQHLRAGASAPGVASMSLPSPLTARAVPRPRRNHPRASTRTAAWAGRCTAESPRPPTIRFRHRATPTRPRRAYSGRAEPAAVAPRARCRTPITNFDDRTPFRVRQRRRSGETVEPSSPVTRQQVVVLHHHHPDHPAPREPARRQVGRSEPVSRSVPSLRRNRHLSPANTGGSHPALGGVRSSTSIHWCTMALSVAARAAASGTAVASVEDVPSPGLRS